MLGKNRVEAIGIMSAVRATHAEKAHEVPAKDRVENRKDLNQALHALARDADALEILLAEREMLASELRIAYEPSQVSSIEAAMKDIDAALRTIDMLRNNPEGYRNLNEGMSHEKNRIGGLPRDEARQCYKAHMTRLQNYKKTTGLSREDLEYLTLRRDLIAIAEKSYTQEQRDVLGA